MQKDQKGRAPVVQTKLASTSKKAEGEDQQKPQKVTGEGRRGGVGLGSGGGGSRRLIQTKVASTSKAEGEDQQKPWKVTEGCGRSSGGGGSCCCLTISVVVISKSLPAS